MFIVVCYAHNGSISLCPSEAPSFLAVLVLHSTKKPTDKHLFKTHVRLSPRVCRTWQA